MQQKNTIGEIKKLLQMITNEEDPLLFELRKDTRKGVQNALQQWGKAREKEKLLLEKQQQMLVEERKLQEAGYHIIAGIDEVGRGPLAGPVVAAAVVLPTDLEALPINDSKKLSAAVREELYEIIMEKAQVGIGVIDHSVIDEVNIYEATKLAMEKAINNLPVKPDALLIDAMRLPIPIKQVSLIKGDAHSYSIAAASIIAKEYRDRMMKEYADQYPHYGFDKNAGYGTKAHLEGLKSYGVTPIHRRTFEPIKTLIKK